MEWFPSTGLIPAEQITKLVTPTDDADLSIWREYHRQMVLWIDWQHDIEQWRRSVESRLEGLEEVTNLIPEILEHLRPQTLTADHQRGPEVRPVAARADGQAVPTDLG